MDDLIARMKGLAGAWFCCDWMCFGNVGDDVGLPGCWFRDVIGGVVVW